MFTSKNTIGSRLFFFPSGLSWEPVCLVEGTLALQQVNVVLDYIE